MQECKSEQIHKAFSSRKFSKLRKIEAELLNELLKKFSQNMLQVAIITYVLSKILSKPRFFAKENKQEIIQIENKLKELCDYKAQTKDYDKKMNEVEQAIVALEKKDPRYIFDLFTKAKVKIAATLYAKGMSLGVVSKETNIPKEEILSYAGKTMMFDRLKEEMTMKDRVKLAKKIILGD